ncbi:TPA: hypothetical protein MHR78_10310 [Klebsiella variicola]|uniref:hypothetical protein n=1 Tax=Enterobacterales TaxID=91347 RepID=UPI0007349D01|nr:MULTISPECIES: hypothetical protein [Enterobacterales]HBZ7810783.1 hypothetical protein [Klebsiella variicola subsp. variicola]KTQ45834.1 hypothetical protein NS104_18545 [Enterobacter cancerogenus]KTQ51260.1 hypothetical protein NS111_14385 [Enterobacter cancerogenus]KTQ75566.1 hypothetical protein NS188_01845 [Enterobacter cancerogenus]KTQ76060.1 hypothetical protein NS31R_23010 [Enterobacter cancerogenus]
MKEIIALPSRNNNNRNTPNKSLRTHCISVRLNHEELQLLNARRGEKSKGEWLRLTFLNKLPVAIPAVNMEAWKSLADMSQKLNRLVLHLDTKSKESSLTQTELFAVKRQISELRMNLIISDLWK